MFNNLIMKTNFILHNKRQTEGLCVEIQPQGCKNFDVNLKLLPWPICRWTEYSSLAFSALVGAKITFSYGAQKLSKSRILFQNHNFMMTKNFRNSSSLHKNGYNM